MTKKLKNKTEEEEEEEQAAAEGDDKVVLLKEGKKKNNNGQLNLLAESLVWLLSLQCQNWPLGEWGRLSKIPLVFKRTS